MKNQSSFIEGNLQSLFERFQSPDTKQLAFLIYRNTCFDMKQLDFPFLQKYMF